MGSHNSKSNKNVSIPIPKYPILYKSNDEQDNRKHSPNNQINDLKYQTLNKDLNVSREYLSPSFHRDISSVKRHENDSEYEYFPDNNNFADQDEPVVYQTVADEDYSDGLRTPSQEEVYLNHTKKLHIKEHYLEETASEEFDKLKREQWHKFYYKVPPKKSPKEKKKFGFENKNEILSTKKTVYVHHFPDDLNPENYFIYPPMIYQFDDTFNQVKETNF